MTKQNDREFRRNGNRAFTRAVSTAAAIAVLAGGGVSAASPTSSVGAGGYDLVSYHTNKKPLRGNGNHVASHEGVAYLFATEANRTEFQRSPEKYVPAYGGYCAYGVSVGKKFVADPDVWEVVDGRLYLNLDNSVKGLWRQDISGHIETANATWPKIRDKKPSEL